MAAPLSGKQPFLSLPGLAWKLKTAFYKQWVIWQDRHGWYGYDDWIKEREATTGSQEDDSPNQDVTFSLLISIQKDNLSHLAGTLASLQNQAYTSWEAILLIDQKLLAAGRGEIPRSLAGDPRLRVVERSAEPSRVLPVALSATRGAWVTRLESGDRLPPHALQQLAQRLVAHPETDILYTDEDQLTPDGKRKAPFFKPDWSPELLLSVNYLENAFFRRELLLQAVTQSPAWPDAVYRSAEIARQIDHLPQVLVHRRAAPAERMLPVEAVRRHLGRLGLQGVSAERRANNLYQFTWAGEERLVSIVIPTKDKLAYLRRCLESIESRTDYPRYEVVLVDSGSQEAQTLEYYESLRLRPDLHLVNYTGPFNFSAALNLGARQARGDVVLFLNNDTEALEPGWLAELVRWAERPEIGIVGAKLLYPDETIQHAGIVIGMEGHASHVFSGADEGHCGPFGCAGWYRNYSAVTGACLAIRREVFSEIGGFDEGYELVFSDIEICLRAIRAGYRVVYTPFARLRHYEGQTRLNHIPPADIRRGYVQFKEVVGSGDPCYNPNLSTVVRIPSLRRPGEANPLQRLEHIDRYMGAF